MQTKKMLQPLQRMSARLQARRKILIDTQPAYGGTMSQMSQNQEFHNLDNPNDGLFRDLAPGLTTRIFAGEHAMLSVVTLAPHAEGTMHHHPEEQWGVLLEGSAFRMQGGEEIAVKKGDFWRTPGNVPHTMRAGPEGARVLDIFSPPRPEYKKPGSGFGNS
jgi:quercetin dioxygenase-like cupin family protein